jgi:uroporphyrinogen-III decarboxylase
MMADLAQTVRAHEGAAYCLLPFCHTLEAEALGADIYLGDGLTTPRARNPRCGSLAEVLELTMDFSASRLRETLEACRLLKTRGEMILFQISGPLTILNSLLPSDLVFRAFRKEPELLLRVFRKLGDDVLALSVLAEEAGADLISYADPMGAVGIVGPRAAEMIAVKFTVDFLRDLDRQLRRETMVLLCPKTAFALLGTELAQWQDHRLPKKMHYGDAVLACRGQFRFAGQSCVKKTAYETENLRELVLQ